MSTICTHTAKYTKTIISLFVCLFVCCLCCKFSQRVIQSRSALARQRPHFKYDTICTVSNFYQQIHTGAFVRTAHTPTRTLHKCIYLCTVTNGKKHFFFLALLLSLMASAMQFRWQCQHLSIHSQLHRHSRAQFQARQCFFQCTCACVCVCV